jgi:hypothetical protein
MRSFLRGLFVYTPAALFLLLRFRVPRFSFYIPVLNFVPVLSHPYHQEENGLGRRNFSAERFLKRRM